MLLKGALHVHTTCSDGLLSIDDVVRSYDELGFDFIAITDHDFLLPRHCLDRGIPVVSSEVLIFQGVELTVFERGYVHVNRIVGDREVLHIFNHPAQLDLPVDQAMERIKAVAGRMPIDAIEITSKGYYTPEFDRADIPFNKVASDDSHSRDGIGRAWIELDSRLDRDAIIRAIKAGDFWNCFQ